MARAEPRRASTAPGATTARGITHSAGRRARIALFDSPTTPPSSIPGLAAVKTSTQTLFSYDQRFLGAIAPGLELGRAFVTPEYQKHYAALMLLWSGIGRYVARHPHLRHLFGAVSLSAAYSPAARATMIASLQTHAGAPELSRLVMPRHATTDPGGLPCPLRTLDDEVTALDAEGKGVPVRLRQYLKLQARAVGFSVDPACGHVVDALMVVDLPQAPVSMLRRYLGAEAAQAHLARHAEARRPGATPVGACA